MSISTLLSPLKCVGYALPTPPRPGSWLIDRQVCFIELRLPELHRTSVLEAPGETTSLALALFIELPLALALWALVPRLAPESP